MYFIPQKKKEGTNVLETEIKVSKFQRELGRRYKISKMHQTTKVTLYEYNPYKDIKNITGWSSTWSYH